MVTVYNPEYHKNRYVKVIKAQLEQRKKDGLCYFCDSPAIDAQTRCQYHHDVACADQRKRSAKFYKTSRAAALDRYGRKCECCGETIERFLTIDHANNDGAAHRKTIATNIYRWLIRNNYPEGFRTLCFNCNLGRYHNGGTCPHKQITEG